MFFLQRPDGVTIERVLHESANLPLSYGSIGLVRRAAPGYDVDETTVVIGCGRTDFERAGSALQAWTHFDLEWVEVFPRTAPIQAGTVVAVLMKHLGFWSLNGCRIVSVMEGDDTRCGFAYGTLTNHAESGEELFEVSLDRSSGTVSYRIRAVSRPRAALARLGYPVVRALQARFRRESADAMRRATRIDVSR
jgi:uncharacterized protein (UPF0548 family)